MKTITLALIIFFIQARGQEIPLFPDPPADVSPIVQLVTKDEPGLRLAIKGRAYEADGTTPIPNLVLFLYQTDATGVYNRNNGSWKQPRLHGWVKTDSQGRFTIFTIKPGSYPRGRTPAHIHVVVRFPGPAPRWLDSFLFADDPLLTTEQKEQARAAGRFSNIIQLTKDQEGTLHGVRDIRISRKP